MYNLRYIDPGIETTNREISLFYYANPYWKESDGGHLDLHFWDFESNKKEKKLIAPVSDRVVIFPSKTVPHGVEPFLGDVRFAATIWMLDNRERKKLTNYRSFEEEEEEEELPSYHRFSPTVRRRKS